MKNKILSIIVLSLLVVSLFASFIAADTSAVLFYQETKGRELTVEKGSDVALDFFVNNAGSESSMRINLDLLDQDENVIRRFVDKTTNKSNFDLTYTFNAFNEAGTYTLRLLATGASGYEDIDTLTLTITDSQTSQNHAPRITSTPETFVNEGDTYTYQVTATDEDVGDAFTYELVSNPPAWLSILPGTSVVTGTAPDVTTNTPFTIGVKVSDLAGASYTQVYTLTVVDKNDGTNGENHAPEFSVSPQSIYENTLYHSEVTATDQDGDSLTYALVSPPSWLTIETLNGKGVISGITPPVSVNTPYEITVRVTDGKAIVDKSYTLTVLNKEVTPVNHPPKVSSIGSADLNEGEQYEYQVVATDQDGDELTYTLLPFYNEPFPDWLTITSDGFISGTTYVDKNTSYSFFVQVSDGEGGTAGQVGTIHVKDINSIVQDRISSGLPKYLDFGPFFGVGSTVRTIQPETSETSATDKGTDIHFNIIWLFVCLIVLLLLIILAVYAMKRQ